MGDLGYRAAFIMPTSPAGAAQCMVVLRTGTRAGQEGTPAQFRQLESDQSPVTGIKTLAGNTDGVNLEPLV